MSRYRGRQEQGRYEVREGYGGERIPRSTGPNMAWFWLITALLVVAGVLVYVVSAPMDSGQPTAGRYISGQPYRRGMPPASMPSVAAMQAVEVGDPKIDLKSVEEALWSAKGKDEKDFDGWMKRFEDEVNAIYFATLKRQKPNADPTTLLPKPVRVDPKRNNDLLTLYGYIDENNKPGYQNGEDKLIFAFQQTKPYNKEARQLGYSLRDGSGYYYRQPEYSHSVSAGMTPFFVGFFLYPMIWHAVWWRASFGWYGSPYWWRGGMFASRYGYYYGRYPGYYGHYRSTYYTHHRPMGWHRGAYYRRGAGGRYYAPGGSAARYRRSQSYGGSRSGRPSGGSRYGSPSGGSRYGGGGRSYGGSRSGGGGGKW